ncbi:DUF4287 domain-containing protein [Nocardioides marmorisolisilvae]|uniref:DUF4287 domain-containing protein n=1 Tax=Nocardioides marmorisolisilvae TaxID=1542737 RepID=A0A3N0DWR8_9ACTN|nr:DUF4287 domain-containing protein [Nocardioides marmorisolisilvae]RNL80045.1 DUF4287 domain-containing protein [Nocardioides marmorisolisilvae]
MTEQRAGEGRGPASYFPSIERTYGRAMVEWFDIVESCDLTRHMELVTMLKTEFGMGHGHANAVVAHVRAQNAAA